MTTHTPPRARSSALLLLISAPLSVYGCMGTDTGNARQGDDLSPLSLQITSSALTAEPPQGEPLESPAGSAEEAPATATAQQAQQDQQAHQDHQAHQVHRVTSGDAALTFTRGAASVAEVELQLAPGVTCEGLSAEGRAALTGGGWRCEGGHIKAEGPFLVDLITGVGAPPLPSVPAGDYKLVDLRLAPTEGVTLSVGGELSLAGGEAAPFSLTLDLNEDARFESADPSTLLSLEAGEPLALFLDVARWFEGVDVGACVSAADITADEAGVLVIDRARGRCQQITTVVRQNIKGSGRVEP
jgi:hypothetical protein